MCDHHHVMVARRGSEQLSCASVDAVYHCEPKVWTTYLRTYDFSAKGEMAEERETNRRQILLDMKQSKDLVGEILKFVYSHLKKSVGTAGLCGAAIIKKTSRARTTIVLDIFSRNDISAFSRLWCVK